MEKAETMLDLLLDEIQQQRPDSDAVDTMSILAEVINEKISGKDVSDEIAGAIKRLML